MPEGGTGAITPVVGTDSMPDSAPDGEVVDGDPGAVVEDGADVGVVAGAVVDGPDGVTVVDGAVLVTNPKSNVVSESPSPVRSPDTAVPVEESVAGVPSSVFVGV